MIQEGEPVFRTPNLECPACQAKRIHVEEEWKKYHPLAGTGTVRSNFIRKDKEQ
jgi:hypothetical protein